MYLNEEYFQLNIQLEKGDFKRKYNFHKQVQILSYCLDGEPCILKRNTVLQDTKRFS